MRPICLTMTAFGPYKEKETVDFSQLADRRLFVISGNTGAGKTTIFDAICYALYDNASGEDRQENRMLRSHFADDQTPTTVELDFAIGTRCYRVMRQLAYRRVNNRSETPPKAELYELIDDEAVPCVDRFTIGEVNSKLQQIIGLTKDQFSQIVMLPQGEFRKLLTSDTENKEDILRRIFRTELYQKVEERFKLLVREKKEFVDKTRTELHYAIRQISSSLPVREASELGDVLDQEQRNVVQLVKALEVELSYYGEKADQYAKEKVVLEQQLQQHTERYHKAAAWNDRFTELENKLADKQRMEERWPQIQLDEHRLSKAERAAFIEPYEEQSRHAAGQVSATKQRLEQQISVMKTSEAQFRQAERTRQEEQAREPERKELERTLHRLDEIAPIVKSLHNRQIELQQLDKEEQRLASERTSSETSLARCEQELQASGQRIKELNDGLAGFDDKKARLIELRQHVTALKDLMKLREHMELYEKQKRESGVSLATLSRQVEELETSWVEGQASLLAVHLHDGEPCPVCGSREHPDKVNADQHVPTREQLDAAKKQLQVAREEYSKADAEAAAAVNGIESKQESLREMGLFFTDLHMQHDRLLAEGKQLREETDLLNEQAEQLKQLRSKREQTEAQLRKLTNDKNEITEKYNKALLERTVHQKALQNDLESIPEAMRSYPTLIQRIEELTKRSDELAMKLKQTQDLHTDTQMKWTQDKAIVAQMENQLQEATANATEQAERLRDEWVKGGFDSEQDYFSAKLREDQRAALKEQIQQFKTLLTALAQRVADLEKELAGQVRVDVESIAADVELYKRGLEQVTTKYQEARTHSQTATGLSDTIEQFNEKLKVEEHTYSEALDVYQIMKGDNALRMSFERYILIEFFEQILQSANERLNRLSNGQFVLHRSDRIERHNRPSGLGLDVFDSYTGQNRDVKTLSGGEKFNASLCLALGMTDVIQANQGGVEIEMMMIDEGFGTLDEESLHKAIDTLIDLQRSGRMIGVISHVQEMRTAFPAVLEVKKTKEGHSRTEMILK